MIKLSGGAEEGRSLCSPVVKGESSKRGVGFGEPWGRFSFCSQTETGGPRRGQHFTHETDSENHKAN